MILPVATAHAVRAEARGERVPRDPLEEAGVLGRELWTSQDIDTRMCVEVRRRPIEPVARNRAIVIGEGEDLAR